MTEESKLYLLIQSDLESKASDFINDLCKALFKHHAAMANSENGSALLHHYLTQQPSYPKICKRYKTQHINKLTRELDSFCLPSTAIGSYGFLVGPCLRQDLSLFLERLQLLNDNLMTLDESTERQKHTIGYRKDIPIPAGKLIPQFAHALQKFVCEHPNSEDAVFSLHRKTPEEMEQEGNTIIDQGRTYFNSATLTTNYTSP